jgi:hypothetical protein
MHARIRNFTILIHLEEGDSKLHPPIKIFIHRLFIRNFDSTQDYIGNGPPKDRHHFGVKMNPKFGSPELPRICIKQRKKGNDESKVVARSKVYSAIFYCKKEKENGTRHLKY